MDASHMGDHLSNVLITEEQIRARLDELAGEIVAEYAGKDLLLVGILKGAVQVMAVPSSVVPPSRRRAMLRCSSCARIARSRRSNARSSSFAIGRRATLIAISFSKAPSQRRARWTIPIPPASTRSTIS